MDGMRVFYLMVIFVDFFFGLGVCFGSLMVSTPLVSFASTLSGLSSSGSSMDR